MVIPELVLANDIINLAKRDGICDLSPLKLQKIMYFVCGNYIARFSEPLIEEPFLKWQYGPALKSIYNQFKTYGASNITNLGIDGWGRSLVSDPWHPDNVNYMSMLRDVWDKYKHKTGRQLVDETHKPGSPWAETCDDCPITNELIKGYFLTKKTCKDK